MDRDERPPEARKRRIEQFEALREEIYASYAKAAADPEFMREIEETNRVWDVTVGDGLEDEEPWPEED